MFYILSLIVAITVMSVLTAEGIKKIEDATKSAVCFVFGIVVVLILAKIIHLMIEEFCVGAVVKIGFLKKRKSKWSSFYLFSYIFLAYIQKNHWWVQCTWKISPKHKLSSKKIKISKYSEAELSLTLNNNLHIMMDRISSIIYSNQLNHDIIIIILWWTEWYKSSYICSINFKNMEKIQFICRKKKKKLNWEKMIKGEKRDLWKVL